MPQPRRPALIRRRVDAGTAAAAVGVLAVFAALVASADRYARLVAPYYAVLARAATAIQHWPVQNLEISFDASTATPLLRLRAEVRTATSAAPAARIVARLQAATAAQVPALYVALLVLWPAGARRERWLRVGIGALPFLAVDAASSVAPLLAPVAYAVAVLSGTPEPVTAWDLWARFVEAGGRFALALVAALAVIAAARALGRHANAAG